MSNAPRREKRTAAVTVHLVPTVRYALEQLASHEGRSISTAAALAIQRDPIVKVFIQKLGQQ